MNKFTKVKKALAVSLCSSMLFSGAPKTSGMDNSTNNTSGVDSTIISGLNAWILNLTKQMIDLTKENNNLMKENNNLLKQIADNSKTNFFKEHSLELVSLATSMLCLVKIVYNSNSMVNDSSKAREIYKKSCYFLKELKDKINDDKKVAIRSNLASARDLVQKCEFHWWHCFKLFGAPESIDKLINSLLLLLSDVFVEVKDLDPKSFKFNLEKYINIIFNRILEVNSNKVNINALNNYVDREYANKLPEVDEVIE